MACRHGAQSLVLLVKVALSIVGGGGDVSMMLGEGRRKVKEPSLRCEQEPA